MYLSKETHFLPDFPEFIGSGKFFAHCRGMIQYFIMTGRAERPGEGRLQEKET